MRKRDHLSLISRQPAVAQGSSLQVKMAFLFDMSTYAVQLQRSKPWGAVLDPLFWEIVEGGGNGGTGGTGGTP